MPASLRCEDLRKIYPGQDGYALGDPHQGVSFEVERGELFALLGPSGCGKTTTLRIIGGFVGPTTGRVYIDEKDVTNSPPYVRQTNTVFQSYALFPHMTVGGNVAFGLAMSGVKRQDRERRVDVALEMVGLPGQQRRRVSELSGGQAQRCALARAIVNRPAILLLDEPLGALDLKLRQQMQGELVRLKGTTDITFVHVTHDQEEACAIADRIAVMDAGNVVQVDTPLDLYRHPRTSYVAEFINAGSLIRGEQKRSPDVFEVSHSAVIVRGPANPRLNGVGSVAAVIPPDRVKLEHSDDELERVRTGSALGIVERTTFTGSVFDCYLRLAGDLELRAVLTFEDVNRLGEMPEPGQVVTASWSPEDVIFVEN
jgi:spermidine/putrescine transport system ATP-binding protein